MTESPQTTVIGPDTTIKGEITVDQSAQILGTIEGRIEGKGEIQLTSGAKCNASVDAGKVTIEGTVTGDITGRESVRLGSKAKLKGDLIAARLIVEEGATFVGHCQVGGDVAKAVGKKKDGAGSIAEAKPSASQKAETAGAR